jgi:hypothetical protein
MLLKKYLILALLIIFTSGCSLLPRITFSKPNTLPQKTVKSESKVKCAGEYKTDKNGNIIYCSKGFYANEEYYNKEERKTTLKEKFINFISNLAGYGFWIFLGLLIFAPGVLGFIFGRLIEGVFGVSKKALQSTVRAIKNAKRNGGEYTNELQREHDKDLKVKKLINEIRAEIE